MTIGFGAALLDTRASRKQAVGDFGWKWAMELEDKQLLPLPAYQDRDFLNELMDQRSKASGIPVTPVVLGPTSSAGLHAPAILAPVSPAPASKAASELCLLLLLALHSQQHLLASTSNLSCQSQVSFLALLLTLTYVLG